VTAGILSVAVLVLLIFMGVQIFVALGVSGTLGLWITRGSHVPALAPTSFFGKLNSFEMIAVPLFILMGNVLAKTPIGRDMFYAAFSWLSGLSGGYCLHRW